MATYNVHLYPVIRVKLNGIEADSQTEAIKKAEDKFFNGEFDEKEAADEISGYLVDEQGDEDYTNSNWYEADGETLSSVADSRKAKIKEFISLIANMKQDGEDDFIMENDDAVMTLNELIETARTLQA